ncbi:hypothetical protein BBJ28_00026671 [Nothophytophthora sp. Chile5]|nr:hypothetical protein BBJ28_00026671 [Nothophytophthora sp. Chile5]
MNIAKTHLLGCQLTLFGSAVTFGLFPTNSRHDGLAVAELMESVMLSAEIKGWQIGAVVTDNAGQCGRARRILALRWPKVIFLICFAHDINNLVKAVLRSAFREVTAQASEAVNCLNASSSKWLHRARNAMIRTYGSHRALMPMCETRWNSMQGCFASLLRARSALEVFAVMNHDEDNYPAALKVLDNPQFWVSLREAEMVVRPLCFASYKLQADENTLADVITCFRDIFDGFVTCEQRDTLVPTIEKRWNACEQPLIMLALFLHPDHLSEARALPCTDVSGLDNMCTFATFYYQKLIGGDPVTLRGEIHDWMRGRFVSGSLSNFSSCSLPPLAAFWRFTRDCRPDAFLPHLAMVIFSVAVNTATCERYFSELALIHTAKRNRMSPEKARKISVVRKLVRDRDGKESPNKADMSPDKRIVNPSEPEKLVGFGTPNRIRSDPQCASPIGPQPNQHPEAESSPTFELSDTDVEESNDHFIEGEDPIGSWEEVLEGLIDSDDDSSGDDSPAMTFVEEDGNVETTSRDGYPPFPNRNDKDFPQEAALHGLRGRKATLEELFMLAVPRSTL